MTAPTRPPLDVLSRSLALVDVSRARSQALEDQYAAEVESAYAEALAAWSAAQESGGSSDGEGSAVGIALLTAALLAALVSIVRRAYAAGAAEGDAYARQQLELFGVDVADLEPRDGALPQPEIADQLVADFVRGQAEVSAAAGPVTTEAAASELAATLQRRAEIASDAALYNGRSAAMRDTFERAESRMPVAVHKMWVARFDLATPPCPLCVRLHGTHVALGAEFPVLDTEPLPYGGHLLGPPRHPNCRCHLVLHALTEERPKTAPSPESMMQYADKVLATHRVSRNEFVSATIVHVEPYTRVVNGKTVNVSGYYYDIQSGLKIPDAQAPSAATKDVSAETAKALTEKSKSTASASPPNPFLAEFGPGTYEVALPDKSYTQVIVHNDGSSTTLHGSQVEEAGPDSTQQFLSYWDGQNAVTKVSESQGGGASDDPWQKPLDALEPSATAKLDATLPPGQYLTPEHGTVGGIVVHDDGSGTMYNKKFDSSSAKPLSAKAVRSLAQQKKDSLIAVEDDEFKSDFAKSLTEAEASEAYGEPASYPVSPATQPSDTLSGPALFPVGNHLVRFETGSQVYAQKAGKDTVYVLDPSGTVTKYNPQGDGVQAQVVAGAEDPAARANLLGKLTNVSEQATLIKDTEPAPGTGEVVLGGWKVTAAQVSTAIGALVNSPSQSVGPTLKKSGSPLAAMDFHAVAAPYKAQFNNKTKPAFLAALKAAEAKAGHTPPEAMGAVAHLEQDHGLSGHQADLAASDLATIHDAIHATDPEAVPHTDAGPGLIDVGGLLATPEQVSAAISALQAEKSTSVKGPLKKADSPLAGAPLQQLANEHAGTKLHYGKLKPAVIGMLQDTLSEHQQQAPPSDPPQVAQPPDAITVGGVTGSVAQFVAVKDAVQDMDLDEFSSAGSIPSELAEELPGNPFVALDFGQLAENANLAPVPMSQMNAVLYTEFVDELESAGYSASGANVSAVLPSTPGSSLPPGVDPQQPVTLVTPWDPEGSASGSLAELQEFRDWVAATSDLSVTNPLQLPDNPFAQQWSVMDLSSAFLDMNPYAPSLGFKAEALAYLQTTIDNAASGPASSPGPAPQTAVLDGVEVTKAQLDAAVSLLQSETSTSVKKPLKAVDHPLAGADLRALAEQQAGAKIHYGKLKPAVIALLQQRSAELAEPAAAPEPPPAPSAPPSPSAPQQHPVTQTGSGITAMDGTYIPPGTYVSEDTSSTILVAEGKATYQLPSGYESSLSGPFEIAEMFTDFHLPGAQPPLASSSVLDETAEVPAQQIAGVYLYGDVSAATLVVYPDGSGKMVASASAGLPGSAPVPAASVQALLDSGAVHKVSDTPVDPVQVSPDGVVAGHYVALSNNGVPVTYDVLPEGITLVSSPHGHALLDTKMVSTKLWGLGSGPQASASSLPQGLSQVPLVKKSGFAEGEYQLPSGKKYVVDASGPRVAESGQPVPPESFAQLLLGGRLTWQGSGAADPEAPAPGQPEKVNGLFVGDYVHKHGPLYGSATITVSSFGSLTTDDGYEASADHLKKQVTAGEYYKVGVYTADYNSQETFTIYPDGTVTQTIGDVTKPAPWDLADPSTADGMYSHYTFAQDLANSEGFAQAVAPGDSPGDAQAMAPAGLTPEGYKVGVYQDPGSGSTFTLLSDGSLSLADQDMLIDYDMDPDVLIDDGVFQFVAPPEAPAPVGSANPAADLVPISAIPTTGPWWYIMDKPQLIQVAQQWAADAGYEGVAALHLGGQKKAAIEEWLRHWSKGEWKQAYFIEATKVKKHKKNKEHPGSPENPSNAGGFEQKKMAPAVPGELPAGTIPPGTWPDVSQSNYGPESIHKWDPEMIDQYLLAAGMQNPTGLSDYQKKWWVKEHYLGDKIAVDQKSAHAQKMVAAGKHLSEAVVPPVEKYPSGMAVPAGPEWAPFDPAKSHAKNLTTAQLDQYLNHLAPSSQVKVLKTQPEDVKQQIVQLHYVAGLPQGSAAFKDSSTAKQEMSELLAYLGQVQPHADLSSLPGKFREMLQVSEHTYTRSKTQPSGLNGHTEIIQVEDESGRVFLFKVAQKAFRADSEHATHQLASLVGHTVADSRLGEFEGKFGQFQAKLDSKSTLQGVAPADLPIAALKDVVNSHVFDWMVSNDDAAGRNFLLAPDGQRVYPIDVGRAFAAFGKPGQMQLKRGKTSALESTYYDRIYSDAVSGKLPEDDVDKLYSSTLATARRLQRADDAQFSAILAQGLERRTNYSHTAAADREELIQQVLARKAALVTDFEAFWDDLYAEMGRAKPEPSHELSQHVFSGNTAEWHQRAAQAGAGGAATFFAGTDLEDAHLLAQVVTKPGEQGQQPAPAAAEKQKVVYPDLLPDGAVVTDAQGVDYVVDKEVGGIYPAAMGPDAFVTWDEHYSLLKQGPLYADPAVLPPPNTSDYQGYSTGTYELYDEFGDPFTVTLLPDGSTLGWELSTDEFLEFVDEDLATFLAPLTPEQTAAPTSTQADPNAGKELWLSGQLRKDADARLRQWLQANLTEPIVKKASQSPQAKAQQMLADLGVSQWSTRIQNAAKTVSYHHKQGDTNYNSQRMEELEAARNAIATAKAYNESGNFPAPIKDSPQDIEQYKKLVQFYDEQIEKIDALKTNGGISKAGDFPEFTWIYHEPVAVDPPVKAEPAIKVEMREAFFEEGRVDSSGDLVATGDVLSGSKMKEIYDADGKKVGNASGTGQRGRIYVATLSDGTQIEYRSWSSDDGIPKSQQGALKVRVRNYDGVGSTEAALDGLRTMGLDLTPAEEEDHELFYWRHLYGILQDRRDRDSPPYKQVVQAVSGNAAISNPSSKDAELAAWRAAWSQVDQEAVDKFVAERRYLPRFSHPNLSDPEVVGGQPYWMRFDATPGQVGKWKMPVRSSSKSTTMLQMIKSSGFYSTEDRTKVLGFWIGGMSSDADQGHGSANFTFLRQNLSGSSYQYYFNPKVLARTSNYAFAGDNFGEINYRKTGSYFNLDEATKFSSGGNEVLIKHALTVLDDLELVGFMDQQSLNDAIAFLHSKGIYSIRGLEVEKRLVLQANIQQALSAVRAHLKSQGEDVEGLL